MQRLMQPTAGEGKKTYFYIYETELCWIQLWLKSLGFVGRLALGLAVLVKNFAAG
jgi:hypothetical protein